MPCRGPNVNLVPEEQARPAGQKLGWSLHALGITLQRLGGGGLLAQLRTAAKGDRTPGDPGFRLLGHPVPRQWPRGMSSG